MIEPTKQDQPEITTLEVLEACQQELNQVRNQLWQLQSRIARYDRIFESAFREEAEQRLGLKSQCQGYVAETEAGPLQQLRWQKTKDMRG